MTAKDLHIRSIEARHANAFVRAHHYSGKVDTRSQVHLGVYWHDRLEGVLQFGPSIDKNKSIGIVRDTPWNGFMELHRLAFTDRLPRNSESRAISVSMRLIRKHAPHIQWILSYADGTQCGDGTIYRASGFHLIGIKKNTSMWRMPDGEVIAKIVLEPGSPPAPLTRTASRHATGKPAPKHPPRSYAASEPSNSPDTNSATSTSSTRPHATDSPSPSSPTPTSTSRGRGCIVGNAVEV